MKINLKTTRDAGSCNTCTYDSSYVYEVQLTGYRFRMCFSCLKEFVEKAKEELDNEVI